MYSFLRKILFFLPAETAHYFSMNCLRFACSIGFKRIIAYFFTPKTKGYSWEMLGLNFRNPVGLGAGFDKNAKYLRELEALGFGFIEIGTVTPVAQAGNAKPRLFRLPKDKALINRMGFNNEGVAVVTARLKKWRSQNPNKSSRLIIGGNIGKNKNTANEDAWKDYEICFKELHNYVDYFVVNVSSPNTPGLRELQEKESLGKILRHLQMINNGKAVSKPILLKIAPDLTEAQVRDVIDLALEINLDGLVVANTTISRDGLSEASLKNDKEPGGLSGMPLFKKSTDMLRFISEETNGSIPLIGSGGIFTAEQASEKIAAGAALVQVWTSFIYEGPGVVKRIVTGLRS
jgi:dihydroorotate dehydrogenase